MRNVISFIGVLLLLIGVVWFIFTFVLITDESRINKIIQKCKNGFESGSVLSIASELSVDYTDRSGLDKTAVIGALKSLFDATSSRSLSFSSLEIVVIGETAQATILCTLNFEPTSGSAMVIPRMTDLNEKRLSIYIEFVKIKNYWRVTLTDWKRIS